MGTNKPIVMERPQRGREMVSKQIAGQQKGKTTLMHEGYVGGSKYLVPDEDLEVSERSLSCSLAYSTVQNTPPNTTTLLTLLSSRRYSAIT